MASLLCSSSVKDSPEERRRDLIAQRKVVALERAHLVLAHLSRLGVVAELFGSINNARFGLPSDVDFLVRHCPDGLRYRIESGVERIMREIPFDVVYYDELSESFKQNSKDFPRA